MAPATNMSSSTTTYMSATAKTSAHAASPTKTTPSYVAPTLLMKLIGVEI